MNFNCRKRSTKELLRAAFSRHLCCLLKRILDEVCCLVTAMVVMAIVLFPITLLVLAVYGLVVGCKKCKKKCEKRRKERKTKKLWEKDDEEAAVALGMILTDQKGQNRR